MKKSEYKQCEYMHTSSSLINSLAVGADTIIRRAIGEIKPSSTALSMNDNNEL